MKSTFSISLFACTIIIIIPLLQGCSSTRYISQTNYCLSSVKTPDKIEIVSSDGRVQDKDIAFIPTMGKEYFKITISNETPNSIKVVWDSGAFIDEQGVSHRIIHTGVKNIDKEKAQVPSVIPSSTQIVDVVAPSDYIRLGNNDWIYEPLIKKQGLNSYKTREEAERFNEQLNPVKLMIPIERDGKVQEYTLTFTPYSTEAIETRELNVRNTGFAVLGAVIGGAIGSILIGLLIR